MYVELSAFWGIRGPQCRVKIRHVWALDTQPLSARCAVSFRLLSAFVNDKLKSQCRREMLDVTLVASLSCMISRKSEDFQVSALLVHWRVLVDRSRRAFISEPAVLQVITRASSQLRVRHKYKHG